MNGPLSRHERGYRALLVLYPTEFRREYGDALTQFFGDDVRERGAARGWGRALSDLVVSVPVQHVEVTLMRRTPMRTLGMLGLPVLAAFAAIGFGHFVVLLVPLALGASVVMYLSSRRAYNEAVVGAASAWWRVLLAGVLVQAGIGVADDYGPDLEWWPWYLTIFIWLVGWALLAVGTGLGLLRLWRTLRPRPAPSF